MLFRSKPASWPAGCANWRGTSNCVRAKCAMQSAKRGDSDSQMKSLFQRKRLNGFRLGVLDQFPGDAFAAIGRHDIAFGDWRCG